MLRRVLCSIVVAFFFSSMILVSGILFIEDFAVRVAMVTVGGVGTFTGTMLGYKLGAMLEN